MATKLQDLKELLAQDLKMKAGLESMKGIFAQETFTRAMAEIDTVINARETEITIAEVPTDSNPIEHMKVFLEHLKKMEKDGIFYASDGEQQIKDLEQRISDAEADAAEEARGCIWTIDTGYCSLDSLGTS